MEELRRRARKLGAAHSLQLAPYNEKVAAAAAEAEAQRIVAQCEQREADVESSAARKRMVSEAKVVALMKLVQSGTSPLELKRRFLADVRAEEEAQAARDDGEELARVLARMRASFGLRRLRSRRAEEVATQARLQREAEEAPKIDAIEASELSQRVLADEIAKIEAATARARAAAAAHKKAEVQARRTLGRLTKQQQKAETEAQAAAAEALVSSTTGGASRLTRSSAVSVASGPRSHVYDGAPPRVPPVRTPAEVADLAMRRRQRKIEDALRVAKRAELTQQLRAAQAERLALAAEYEAEFAAIPGAVTPQAGSSRERGAALTSRPRLPAALAGSMGAASAREFSSRATTPATPAGDAARSPRAAAGPACQAVRAARPSTAPFMSQKRRAEGLLLSGAGQGPPPGAKPPTASGGRNGRERAPAWVPSPRAPPAAGAAPAPAFSPALDREARTKMIVRGLYNKM